MKQMDWRIKGTNLLIRALDGQPPDKPHMGTPMLIYGNGPVTGIVEKTGLQRLPPGTRLDGHLWVSAPGDKVFGRFTRAHLSNGTTLPICLELCDGIDIVGTRKEGPGPREGTVLMQEYVRVCAVDAWR